MDITWKVSIMSESLSADRLARILARLILDADHGARGAGAGEGCEQARGEGRNEEVPTTQEVSL